MADSAQPYDRSSKWLIEHYGAAILRLAGLTGLVSCRTVSPDLVLPLQLPDGLLEVRLAGHAEPVLWIVEIATYPQRRVSEQVLRDALIVLLDRRVMPEVVTLVLHPKGTYVVPGVEVYASKLQWSSVRINWRVVELWKVPAAQLLAANDVGLIPWVPLTNFDGPPAALLQQCRERIDQAAPPEEHANLLVVTQILMRLRYNDPQFFAIFGGQQAMIESPLLDELREFIEHRTRVDSMQKATVRALTARFGPHVTDLDAAIRQVTDESVLDALLDHAVTCATLDDFRAKLPS